LTDGQKPAKVSLLLFGSITQMGAPQ